MEHAVELNTMLTTSEKFDWLVWFNREIGTDWDEGSFEMYDEEGNYLETQWSIIMFDIEDDELDKIKKREDFVLKERDTHKPLIVIGKHSTQNNIATTRSR